ncbi:ABC transporter permease [Desulfuromonas versatilis]|uniref:ABC transporter permease n=1 Tax=Desulfuromonas versatilis TaxID=2802975 RepID=UPI00384A8D85
MALCKSLWWNRQLIFQMTKREVIGRYRGSVMGLLWSFFNPVLMLAVYTFVFSVVFKARWGASGSGSKTEFALVLFSGLIVFNFFSECINRAPGLILNNGNFVKKVVFPLEILPVITIGSALFHFFISFIVWVIFYLVFFGAPPITILFLPLELLPLVFLTTGLCWFLASLGVYLRDVTQVVSVLTTVLMFLSPIFYPLSSLPEKYHIFLFLNPLTHIIEVIRNAMFWGQLINPRIWLFSVVLSGLVAWLGFAWFQKTRKGFADVL